MAGNGGTNGGLDCEGSVLSSEVRMSIFKHTEHNIAYTFFYRSSKTRAMFNSSQKYTKLFGKNRFDFFITATATTTTRVLRFHLMSITEWMPREKEQRIHSNWNEIADKVEKREYKVLNNEENMKKLRILVFKLTKSERKLENYRIERQLMNRISFKIQLSTIC